MWVFLNDRFVPKKEAVVSVFDHGFLYGDGVYETIRSYGPRIFMRDQHLTRLRRSAEAIGLVIPIPLSHGLDLLHEAMPSMRSATIVWMPTSALPCRAVKGRSGWTPVSARTRPWSS